MEQIIKDIIAWMNGESVTEETLCEYLRSKGLSENDIDYIIGQLTDWGFSVLNHNITYRGMNYKASLPPDQH